MGRHSKRYREMVKLVDRNKSYTLVDAIAILKKCAPTKFDQSLEVAIKLGVDPRKSDQQVRNTVSLPNGTGKKTIVLVIAQGDKIKEALDAGADYAGGEEYLEKIRSGWTDVTSIISTPDMMREVGKLGKILGPRGLMPTPKAGNVTSDVARAVQEIKRGKVEFKMDRNAVINSAVGKLSFDTEKLIENIQALSNAIARAKPSTAKGSFFVSATISSTMGPGMKLELREITA